MSLNEPWSEQVDPKHWYGHAIEYVRANLRTPAGKCLVIGSPPAEANMIADMGLAVTHFDIRLPPPGNYAWVQGDARLLPFPDGSFDCVTSTCVLCHVGTGRYGDVLDSDGSRGDDVMLGEIARVLRKDGRAVLMWGPCDPAAGNTKTEPVHRTYCLDDMRQLVVKHRLSLLDSDIDKDSYLSTVLMK